MTIWRTTRFAIDLAQPRVMGIVNVTPDSFSDGGSHASTEAAVRHCMQLVEEGADILDIGGESTRPGSPAVPLPQELDRVLPVVREAVKLGVPLSVDTYKPEVMRAALELGADIVNDVWALRRPGAREAVAAHPSCGICLMHMHRDPQTMQAAPMEGDVLPAVRAFLEQQSQLLLALKVDAAPHRDRPGHRLRQDRGAEFRLARTPAGVARRRPAAPGGLVAQVFARRRRRHRRGSRAHGAQRGRSGPGGRAGCSHRARA